MKLAALTLLALLAFAANSVLCRLALRSGSIDPASFTSIRLVSGAMTLALIAMLASKPVWKEGSWVSGFLLFGYAIAFSLAYIGLTAGTGALILFGCVQATMIMGSMFQGTMPAVRQWAGLTVAFAGLVALVMPGLSAPPIESALLMVIAGVSWDIYSLRGRSSTDAIASTTGNFVRAAPLGLLAGAGWLSTAHAATSGVLLAVTSGAVTSGLGYVAWYRVLPALGSVRAAVVQLAVPVVATGAGILLLGESLTLRVALASVVTLAGVAMATLRTQ